MTVTRLRFEDPPKRAYRPRKTKHERIAEKLTNRPGQWALIDNYASVASVNSMAYMVRNGKIKAYQPAGSFEAVARTADGKHRMWARYVGAGGEHA